MKTSPDALLTIAFKLFLTNGYKETSMQDLARASGMSKGAFHHYFPRKQDILDACLRRFFWDYLPDTDMDPDQSVAAFARDAAANYAESLVMMVRHDIPLASYQAFMWSQMRDAPELFISKQIAVLEHLTKGFERQHPGKGRALAEKLFALIEGTAVLLSVNPPQDPAEITRRLEAVTDDFFADLAQN
jgi:AcrR family transcriptional regulator